MPIDKALTQGDAQPKGRKKGLKGGAGGDVRGNNSLTHTLLAFPNAGWNKADTDTETQVPLGSSYHTMGLFLKHDGYSGANTNNATTKIVNQGSDYIPPPTAILAVSGIAGAIDVSWTKGNATVTTEVMCVPASTVALSDIFRGNPDGENEPVNGITSNDDSYPESGAGVVIVTNAANDETKTVTGLTSGADYAVAVRSIASSTEANTTGDVGRAGVWVWKTTVTTAG